jgi:two-component system, LytTR family, response regulator LytT
MRIAICDDHLPETKKYEEIFRKAAKTQHINYDTVYYESGHQMLIDFEFDRQQFADIILLDIAMPGYSGMEAAHELRNAGYSGEIIFLTVSKQHMLEAFDVAALHYIIKNETPDQKVEDICSRTISEVSKKEQECILLSAGNEYRNIAINSIYYFDIYKKIATVHYEDTTFEFYCASLEKVEKQLEGLGFIRIHRGYLAALSKLVQYSYDTVTLSNGKTLPVGRKYYPELKEAFANAAKTVAAI